MELNLTLLLILSILALSLIMFFLIKNMYYKIKRKIFSFGLIKIIGLFGGISVANVQAVKQVVGQIF